MTRRKLFGAVIAALAAPALVVAATEPKRYGRLTLKEWMYYLRLKGECLHIYLDGEDVTRRVFEANDRLGYVRLWCRDRENHSDWRRTDGYQHIDRSSWWSGVAGQPRGCTLYVEGRVEIRPGDRF